MRAGLLPLAPRRQWRRRTVSRPIVGEGNGSRTPSAASGIDQRVGERRVDAPTSIRPKLDFRLEHELQTACEAAALSRRGFAITDAYRAIQCSSMALPTLT